MYPRYRYLKGLASREYFRAAAAILFGYGSALDDYVGATGVVVPGNNVARLHRDLRHRDVRSDHLNSHQDGIVPRARRTEVSAYAVGLRRC